MNLRVVTANLNNKAHDATRREQAAELRRLVSLCHPDVIGAVEALPGLRAPRGYSVVRFTGPSLHEQVWIVRNTLVRLIEGSGAEKAHEGRRGLWPHKWTSWLQLDGWGTLALVHFNAHIEVGGRPRVEMIDTDKMRFARRHIALAARFARRRIRDGEAVAVLGDFNVCALADQRERHPWFPAAVLGKAGLADVNPPGKVGTLGSRRVDRIMVTPNLVPVGQVRRLARNPRLDHHAVFAELRRVA